MTTQSAKSVPETPNVLSGEDTSIRPMTLVPSSSPEGIEERAAAIDSESGTQVAPAVAGPAPSVYFSGMPPRNGTNITDVVGGSVGDIVVQAPTGSGLQVTSVDLVISGGESKQDYTWYAGITTPAPATTTFAGNSTNLYTTGLWWDEKTGNHTITVTAHYNNNTTGTATLTANIVKPTVNSFTLRYQPLQFSDPGYTRPGYSNPWIGFHQGVDGGKTGDNAITPGDQFFASVSTTGMPVGGTFAILQKINADWSITTNAGAKYTRNSNGDVLDPRPDTNLIFTNPFLFGFKSTLVPAGTTNAPIPQSGYGQGTAYAGSVPDGPWLSYQPYVDANNQLVSWHQIRLVSSFTTYLMYQAPNGIWVGLSKLTWSLKGDKTWNGSQWNDTSANLPLSPSSSGTVSGVNNTTFVSWTNSFDPDPTYPPRAGGSTPLGVPWRGPDGKEGRPPTNPFPS